MKVKLLKGLCIVCSLSACHPRNHPLVIAAYADSLINNYRTPPLSVQNDSEIVFWEKRIDPARPGLVSELRYAAALSQRFRYFGDIRDIYCADSVARRVDSLFNHHESQAMLTLTGYSILQHRFTEAAEWLKKAKYLGIKKYDDLSYSFDVDYELGRYYDAGVALKQMKSGADYSYLFRNAKMHHLNGEPDSAVADMIKAAGLENTNPWLQTIALSNAADLLVHSGSPERAAPLYRTCLELNGADFHSLLGLGWIALVCDKNDTLAEKIFSFAASKNKLPDALFRMIQTAEFRGDKILELKYARDFERTVSTPLYGSMYNKYLIQLYTGILNEPQKAEALARKELDNRATPPTYAWYAWSLFCNGRSAEALGIYKKYVSGLPLEGLELYWMGKMMEGMGKTYNANAFFSAAKKNIYDLSPGIQKELMKFSE